MPADLISYVFIGAENIFLRKIYFLVNVKKNEISWLYLTTGYHKEFHKDFDARVFPAGLGYLKKSYKSLEKALIIFCDISK